MSNIDSLVGGFRSSLKKQSPKKNPIQDHPLANADDEVRKMYIDTLCVVAQYETENSERQLALVERIHSGAGLTNNFSEHIDGVSDITSEQLHAFIKVCKENKLENIFVLECMLISQADGNRNEEQFNFSLDLAEALGLKEDRTSVLAELADVITAKDSEGYREVYEKLSPADATEIIGGAVGYIKEFVSGVLIDTPDLLWIYSQKQNEYVVEKSDIEESSFSSYMSFMGTKIKYSYDGHIKIIFENAAIKDGLGFENCKSVALKNCTANKPICYKNVNDVTIDGCCFDFNNEEQLGALYAEKVNSILISGCKFSNMSFDGQSKALLNYYRNDDIITPRETFCANFTINIENTSFFNLRNSTGCTIFPRKNGTLKMWACRIDNSQTINVKNCDFTNCSGKALFAPDINTKLENNKYNNCCSVNA